MGTVEPIRNGRNLESVKDWLKSNAALRDWALFVVGINVALRISDLLRLTVGEVLGSDGQVLAELTIRVGKTKRTLVVHLPPNAQEALGEYLAKEHPFATNRDAPLFPANPKAVKHRGPNTPAGPMKAVSREWVTRKIKQAVAVFDPTINVGSHTMRKTWGYQAHQAQVPIGTIMHKLGHRTQRVTLSYLGITNDEVKQATYELNL